MSRSVVIAGGGTGGHIEPALALADALRRADPAIRIACLGTERGLETRVVPARGYALELIPAVPLPRKPTPALLSVPGRMAAAVSAAAAVLDRVGADVVVGFGGYVATPGYLAAKRRRVPIVVHEANARPGLANRIGSRLTTHVFTGQPDTSLRHSRYIGIPIRHQIGSLDRLAGSDAARSHFGLRPDLPVLLVTGGSQGAASINRAVLGAADALLAAGIQVLHIIGPRSGTDLRAPSGAVPYVTIEYLDRMDLAYCAADFVLCRAGAMTCAELTAVGLPAAYIPLPHGNGEQRLNALPIERAGGGLILDDASLSPDWIRSVLLRVLLDHEQVAGMSRAAAGAGNRDADSALAAAVIEVADAAAQRGGAVRKAARARATARSGSGPAGWGPNVAADPAGWGPNVAADPAGWGPNVAADPAGWGPNVAADPAGGEPAGWDPDGPAGWGPGGQPGGPGGGPAGRGPQAPGRRPGNGPGGRHRGSHRSR